jgi:TetR/AcrR family transcriptional repressor of lmrAB and yxaGH operons
MPRTYFEHGDAVAAVAEVFRELGYEGASLSQITVRTGLSRGSLYHFFPNGKEQMATEVLMHVDAWFVKEVYEPLERQDASLAIQRMWTSVENYFQSGRKVCLIGAFALSETRDLFARQIKVYFKRWIAALADAYLRAGLDERQSQDLAEEAVGGIQGALVLSRALNDRALFLRSLDGLRQRTVRVLQGELVTKASKAQSTARIRK